MDLVKADPPREVEFEITLAHLMREILDATVGSGLDDAIYASKVEDLSMAILR